MLTGGSQTDDADVAKHDQDNHTTKMNCHELKRVEENTIKYPQNIDTNWYNVYKQWCNWIRSDVSLTTYEFA